MINQYTQHTLSQIIQTRYGKTIFDFLDDCRKNRLSYKEVAQLIGYTESTIRKYCRKYQITLNKLPTNISTSDSLYHNLLSSLQDCRFTAQNALYKKWLHS